MLVLGRDRLLGPPKSCDVVVDFLFRRDLEQNDGSLTPIADRLDPQAWATFETRFEIIVSNEDLLSLHQSVAARTEVGESAEPADRADSLDVARAAHPCRCSLRGRPNRGRPCR